MIGGSSKFFVASTGNIGIGTTRQPQPRGEQCGVGHGDRDHHREHVLDQRLRIGLLSDGKRAARPPRRPPCRAATCSASSVGAGMARPRSAPIRRDGRTRRRKLDRHGPRDSARIFHHRRLGQPCRPSGWSSIPRGISASARGAVGGRGSGQGKGPLRIARDLVTAGLKQRGTKHRAADGPRNRGGSDCRPGW